MGYIGSDPVRNDSVSTAQLVDNAVTNPKIVDDIVFTNVTASAVSASGTVTANAFSGDGTNISGVTAEWDGTHTGNGVITGNFNVTGNITGSKVKTVYEGYEGVGKQHISWDPDTLPSGTYFVTLEFENSSLTKKVVLLK